MHEYFKRNQRRGASPLSRYSAELDTIAYKTYNSSMKKYSFRKGFTLAEVLITLGIIGVVAALTIPTLVKNYQKQQLLESLKNSYSIMSNWVKLSEIDNGPMSSWPTGEKMDVNAFWAKYILPYFANARLCASKLACGYKGDNVNYDTDWSCGGSWSVVTNDTRLLFMLKNGVVVFMPRNTQDAEGNPLYVTLVFVDVNGPSGPNKCGSDVFVFSRANGTFKPNTHNTKSCYNDPHYCADLLMKNGWEYPKDYPY